MQVHIDAGSLNEIFALPSLDGRFEGQLANLARELGQRRPIILFAFPPKSAGTYLRSAAMLATGGSLARIVHAEGGRDPAPYLPTLIAYYLGGVTEGPLVTHIHMQATIGNRHFLNAFDIRPVIMMRSVPDMLASLWDMVEANPRTPFGLSFLVPEEFPYMSRARKSEFFIDMMGPWYASYFASWLHYEEDDPERVCVLHYRDFKENPAEVLKRALEHAKVARTYEECKVALQRTWGDREKFRYNRGVSGRGRDYFSQDQIKRVTRMLSHYDILEPHMDELLGCADQDNRKANERGAPLLELHPTLDSSGWMSLSPFQKR
jgi:hypothetical protein